MAEEKKIPGLTTPEERDRVHQIAGDLMTLCISMHENQPLPALASLLLAAAGAAAATEYSIEEMVELFQHFMSSQRAHDQLLTQITPKGIN